jgi:hypothetical protein
MDKFFKIVGIVVIAWLALGLVGWVFHFLVGAVFWIALVAGGIWAVSAIAAKNRGQIGTRR